VTGCRTLAFEYWRYGRTTLARAGLFVWIGVTWVRRSLVVMRSYCILHRCCLRANSVKHDQIFRCNWSCLPALSSADRGLADRCMGDIGPATPWPDPSSFELAYTVEASACNYYSSHKPAKSSVWLNVRQTTHHRRSRKTLCPIVRLLFPEMCVHFGHSWVSQ